MKLVELTDEMLPLVKFEEILKNALKKEWKPLAAYYLFDRHLTNKRIEFTELMFNYIAGRLIPYRSEYAYFFKNEKKRLFSMEAEKI